MVLEVGEKVHVTSRRTFDEDIRRHFVGEIVGIANTTCRVCGYAFVFDTNRNEFLRKPDKVTRVLSIIDAGNIISVLAKETVIEDIRYTHDKNRGLVVTDGRLFTLDINEFGTRR